MVLQQRKIVWKRNRGKHANIARSTRTSGSQDGFATLREHTHTRTNGSSTTSTGTATSPLAQTSFESLLGRAQCIVTPFSHQPAKSTPSVTKDKNYIVLHLGKKRPTVFKCPINTTQETVIRRQLEISAACHCIPRPLYEAALRILGKAQQVGDGSCTQVLKVVMPVRQSFVAQQQPPSPPVAAFAEEKKKSCGICSLLPGDTQWCMMSVM